MVSIVTTPAVHQPIRGLEQFVKSGDAGGIGFCIAEGNPYALEFHHDRDIVCLVFGDILSRSRFDDDREDEVVFLGGSTAFHPRGGAMRVTASEVRQGFISISYSDQFRELLDDVDIDEIRRGGTRNNIRNLAIKSLVAYARERMRSPETLQSIELQFLATAAYLETIRKLASTPATLRTALSDREFVALAGYVDENLEGKLTCADLVRETDLPMRVIFDGIKSRTGRSPYSFIIERRVRRAEAMLVGSDAPLAEIAAACGFCSQQHMTTTLSRKLGTTPQQIRVDAMRRGKAKGGRPDRR
jgi:AraC family transcriptional regulator